MKAATLKTLNVSSVIKLSNVVDRDEEITPEIYEELYGDMDNAAIVISILMQATLAKISILPLKP